MLRVEVADSSLAFERKVGLPLYARAGIPELWIVDPQRRVFGAHRKPQGDLYGEMTTHQPGERLALAAAPSIVISIVVGLDLVFG